MALCSIVSNNPNLSYVIVKNPTTGPLVKEVRRGHAFGFFDQTPDTQRYCMYFRDADLEVSFKAHPGEDFEYANTTRYNTALWPIIAIGDFLDSASKKQSEHDLPGFSSSFEMNMVLVSNERYLKILAKHYEKIGFFVSSIEVCKNHYNIGIHTDTRTIKELLGATCLLALTLVSKNESDYLPVDEGNLGKYLRAVQTIDAPYQVRGLIRSNFMRSRKLYKDFLSQLNESPSAKYQMTYGDAQTARLEFMKANILPPTKVMDFGCGEGRQVTILAEDYPEATILAVDKDEECREWCWRRCERKDLTNVVMAPGLEELDGQLDDISTILLMEVLEHMPYAEAVETLKKLQHLGAEQIIITLPNGSFNSLLGIEDGQFRHDDHHWEPTRKDVLKLVSDTWDNSYLYSDIRSVGDVVDGQPLTWGLVLTKEKKNV